MVVFFSKLAQILCLTLTQELHTENTRDSWKILNETPPMTNNNELQYLQGIEPSLPIKSKKPQQIPDGAYAAISGSTDSTYRHPEPQKAFNYTS